MFCNECGAKNPDTAKFCSGCGTKFTTKMTTEFNQSDSNNKEDFFNMYEEVQPVAKKEVVTKEEPVEKEKKEVVVRDEKVKPETPKTTANKKEEQIVEEKKVTSVEERLASLSTASIMKQSKPAQSDVNPAVDPYWDDILPEINNEINAIPKDNIIKVLASVAALFIVITYLIYML